MTLLQNYFLNLDYKVNLYDIDEIDKIKFEKNNIICIQPFDINFHLLNKFLHKPIAMWVWEFKILPKKFKQYEQFFSKIYTMSNFCVDVFRNNLSIPVEKLELKSQIHNYLDKIKDNVITNESVNDILRITDDKIRFGYCFDFNSSVIRKNVLNLVKSFYYLNDDTKCLILKTTKLRCDTGSEENKHISKIFNLIKKCKNIFLISDRLSNLELYTLYNNFDYYISPHCGEGFGLTIYDNMILGNKIISPYYSGETDFLNRDEIIELDYEESIIEGLCKHPIYGQMDNCIGSNISVKKILKKISLIGEKKKIETESDTYMVIDCQPIQHEIRGIGRYCVNLVNTIIERTDFKIKLLINDFISDERISLLKLRDGVKIIKVRFPNISNKDHCERNVYFNQNEEKNEIILANVINKINPIIFLNLSEFDKRKVMIKLSLFNKDIKSYSILYDLIPLKNDYLKKVDHQWKLNYIKQIENLKKYNKLLSISEFTTKDCSDIFDNISTIGTGACIKDKSFTSQQVKDCLFNFGINKKYIFCQSAFGENKGFDILFNQYNFLSKEIKDNILLVFGCDIPKYFIDKNKIKDVIITGYLNEDDLYILHENAWLFVFPSSYEGFGLPPVESMLHNKPVIVAKNTSLLEIMKDDNFMFNLCDNSCSELINNLYNNIELYNKCIEHCNNRKDKFKWEYVFDKISPLLYKYKISIILVLHNNGKWLKYLEKKIDNLKRKFELEFMIYENNSNEEFKIQLKQFIENQNGILLSENTKEIKFESVISSERGIHMNNIRNRNKINHGILNSDFTLVLDSDTYFDNSIIINFIEYLLINKDTSMVTGYPFYRNGILTEENKYHYYDSLILSKNGYNFKSTDNTCLMKKCLSCINHRLINNVFVDEKSLIDDGEIVEMDSVFGCMGMIPTKIYNKVFWTDKHGFGETDHYGFCQELKKYGNLILNSNIKFIKSKKSIL